MHNPVTNPTGSKERSRTWIWIGASLLAAMAALLVVGNILIRRAGPILKARVVETLSARLQTRVELDNFNVSALRGLEATGDGLRIYPPENTVLAGANRPLIVLEHFSFHSGLMGLFFVPMHVSTVHVTGMKIDIPPREMRRQGVKSSSKAGGRIKIFTDRVVCEDSWLIMRTAKPGKDPKIFELRHIELREVGPNDPWKYDATLVNAIPRGDIHASGTFGPWKMESPGDSTVTGHYTFEHANLDTIKGIGGMLSSVGDFQGQLNRIVVDGTTDTPDFSLDSGNRPMPLQTQFHAIVDGTSGDTYLEPVRAKLRNSSFTASGVVINVKGQGHIIDLNVDLPNGQLEDFLDLAVKTEPAILTGRVSTKTKLHIRPGKERVAQKLDLDGDFTLRRMHFTNQLVQDKVDMLSLRAQGRPKEAKPGAKDVAAEMRGQFSMREGNLSFRRLLYRLPGADVNLDGVYSLDGKEFDFRGKVRTQATLSEMVASRWKSVLLKPVSPFLKKNGAGAEIPVRINGTKSEPKFGLDVNFGDRKQDGESGKAAKR